MRSIIIFLLLFIANVISAQEIKYQTCKTEWFTVNLPSTWKFIADTSILIDGNTGEERKEIQGGKFISTDKIEASEYADCYGGVIFYVEVMKASLDSAAQTEYEKKDDKYYTTFPHSVWEVDKTKGKNWIGLHSRVSCNIHCKEEDYNAIVEGCETLYFSNNKYTVHFYTTGKELNADVLKVMLSSFRLKK